MDKLWAVRTKWANKALGGDCIQLFNTRQEARLAKKTIKATKALGIAEKVEIHRWIENIQNSAGFISSKVYY
ncbi:hypothetical protein ECBP2_0067 [Escherichia phage ECBP2]|uniref:Uncharacterized protein n=1 Tax=Escherichia phage ECBP2 TaxID=1604355 RepID=J9SNB5_9CAUD|nr:hypothetical protein ECBP2_0067 [Escherichia phage ECBP2]AFR52100.1 hypothetical protein ECBP2_0067 [Escherichia phage ECBP2]